MLANQQEIPMLANQQEIIDTILEAASPEAKSLYTAIKAIEGLGQKGGESRQSVRFVVHRHAKNDKRHRLVVTLEARFGERSSETAVSEVFAGLLLKTGVAVEGAP